jgi:hypothetical protein
MKVTVKAKQEKSCEVPFDEIPVGYIYVVYSTTEPIALKLENNNAVLLGHKGAFSDSNFFKIANGLKGTPAIKILGKLTEVVVEEV